MKMPSKKQLDAFMAASGSRCSRQTTKGQKFRDEGYVRNLMFNELSTTSTYGLLLNSSVYTNSDGTKSGCLGELDGEPAKSVNIALR